MPRTAGVADRIDQRVVIDDINLTRALAIGGWMEPIELYWLAAQAQTHFSIAEVGSFHGRSTRALADHTLGTVYAIDPWDGPYKFEDGTACFTVSNSDYSAFCTNMADSLTTGKVKICRGDLSAFAALDIRPDMVFIDGDHRYEAVKSDILLALDLLEDGGLLCGHDYWQPEWWGVQKAVDELLPHAKICHTIWSVEV